MNFCMVKSKIGNIVATARSPNVTQLIYKWLANIQRIANEFISKFYDGLKNVSFAYSQPDP